MAKDCTSTINETVASFLERKNPRENNPSCATLETYEERPIFILVGITEDAVKLVALKLSGDSGPGGMDSEALQVWLIKFGEDSKILRTSVETFVDWLSNRGPSWSAYSEFMSGLIALDKQPDVRLVGVGKPGGVFFPRSC